MLFSFLIHLAICITLATQEQLVVAQVASLFACFSSFLLNPSSLSFTNPYRLIRSLSLGSNIVNRLALGSDSIETILHSLRKESWSLVCEVVM